MNIRETTDALDFARQCADVMRGYTVNANVSVILAPDSSTSTMYSALVTDEFNVRVAHAIGFTAGEVTYALRVAATNAEAAEKDRIRQLEEALARLKERTQGSLVRTTSTAAQSLKCCDVIPELE